MLYRHWLAADLPSTSADLLSVFQQSASKLASADIRKVEEVRALVAPDLRSLGWTVADGSRSRGGVVLTMIGDATVRADAFLPAAEAALWVETGRSWINLGFLEHMIEAAVCPNVREVILGVRASYEGQPTFSKCASFIEAIIESGRLPLPYASLLLIGF